MQLGVLQPAGVGEAGGQGVGGEPLQQGQRGRQVRQVDLQRSSDGDTTQRHTVLSRSSTSLAMDCEAVVSAQVESETRPVANCVMDSRVSQSCME